MLLSRSLFLRVARRARLAPITLVLVSLVGGSLAISGSATAASLPDTVSPYLAQFTGHMEGSSPTLYSNDGSAGGNCTIGIGHLVNRGPCKANNGDVSTALAQCQSKTGRACTYPLTSEDIRLLFEADVNTRVAPLKSAISGVTLNQPQFDMVMDFYYNVGDGQFRGDANHSPSSVYLDLKAGKMGSIPADFMKWAQGACAGNGLYLRRWSEGQVFSTGGYGYYTTCSGKWVALSAPIASPPAGPTFDPLNVDDSALLKGTSSSTVYVTAGGAKFPISDTNEFTALGYNWNNLKTISDAQINAIPNLPRDGTLIRQLSSPNVYVMTAGARLLVRDPDEFNALGYNWGDIRTLPAQAFNAITTTPVEGTLLRERSSSFIFVIKDGARFLVPTADELNALHYDWNAVRIISNGAMAPISDRPNNDSLVKDRTTSWVYVIRGGARFLVPDTATGNRLNVDWSNMRVLPDGSMLRIAPVPVDGTVLRELDNPNVYVVTNGHKVLVTSQQFSDNNYGPQLRFVPNGALNQIPS